MSLLPEVMLLSVVLLACTGVVCATLLGIRDGVIAYLSNQPKTPPAVAEQDDDQWWRGDSEEEE